MKTEEYLNWLLADMLDKISFWYEMRKNTNRHSLNWHLCNARIEAYNSVVRSIEEQLSEL